MGTAGFIPGYGLGDDRIDDADRLIRRAVEQGVSYIDTAAGYGPSEEYLGRHADFLKDHGVRICTKIGKQSDDRIEDSLRRLQMSQIDTLLLHSAAESDLTDQASVDAILQSKRRGLARRTGASTYGAEAARSAMQQQWCDVVQVEHSIVNPSVVSEANAVRRPGQEIVVRSVLCKGLLTGRLREFRRLPARAAEVLGRLADRAESWGYTLPQLAIRFALDTPGVDVVLVGVSSSTELDVALSAAARPLDESQWASLAEFDSHVEDWAHPERWSEI